MPAAAAASVGIVAARIFSNRCSQDRKKILTKRVKSSILEKKGALRAQMHLQRREIVAGNSQWNGAGVLVSGHVHLAQHLVTKEGQAMHGDNERKASRELRIARLPRLQSAPKQWHHRLPPQPRERT
jgi:hypothetical protein